MKFAALVGLMLLLQNGVAMAQPPQISFTNFITGLTSPIDIVNAGDGTNRLFIAQQGGLIIMYDGGDTTHILDLGPDGENLIRTVGSEEGLLSLVFHPDYGVSSDYFYVYYTNLAGNLELRHMKPCPEPDYPATRQLL